MFLPVNRSICAVTFCRFVVEMVLKLSLVRTVVFGAKYPSSLAILSKYNNKIQWFPFLAKSKNKLFRCVLMFHAKAVIGFQLV